MNPWAAALVVTVLAAGGIVVVLVRRLGYLRRAVETALRDAAVPDKTLPDRMEELRARLLVSEQEQQRLHAVLLGMAEAVVVLDEDQRVVLMNVQAEALFGAPAQQMRGRPVIELSRNPDLHELLAEVREGEGPLVREIAPERDRTRVLQVTATLLRRMGTTAGLILVCHDITDLKRLELARRDFVANVSHELRTPLSAIRGYSETLLGGALDDPQIARRFLGVIERHAERLGRLVDDLLTLSDLELGRAGSRRTPVHPENLIESACELLRDRAEQGQVALRQRIDAACPAFAADPDQMVQVLLNLIENGIKYTPAGGAVTVGARPVTDDASGAVTLELCVEDTGVGISSDQLPRLTERFYRADGARSRELGGTGLGLAIVKHIVQAHGGRLSIESELNRGTRVRLRIPCEVNAKDEPRAPGSEFASSRHD